MIDLISHFRFENNASIFLRSYRNTGSYYSCVTTQSAPTLIKLSHSLTKMQNVQAKELTLIKLESTASWAATLANRGDKKIQVFETISKRIYYRMPQVKERKYEEPSGESITSQVSKYFYEDDDLAYFFEHWCRDRASEIRLDTKENSLEYTFMHKDFVREFEDKLTEFIDSKGSSIEEFYNEIKGVQTDSEEGILVQIINASVDFDVFIEMMRDTAKQVAYEKSNKK